MNFSIAKKLGARQRDITEYGRESTDTRQSDPQGNMAKTRRRDRGKIGWMIFLALLTLGGIGGIVHGLLAQQEVAALAAAPVCASGQVDGCKLDQYVTVIDLDYTSRRYSAPSYFVIVQMPNGRTQRVDEGNGDLYSRLYIGEHLTAELWKNSIIQLDDGAGHYLMASDSPVYQGSVILPEMAFMTVVSSIGLAFLVRRQLRERKANKEMPIIVAG